jgi:CHAT domain-containing protein
VYVSADDMLYQLPFQAFLAADGSSLIDAAPIAYVAGVAVLRRCLEDDKNRTRQSVFAAGVPSSLGGPDCSSDEARTVAAFFNTDPRPATRDALLTEGMSADILHLSCHSNLENVLTSFQGLELEDGTLTNADINAAHSRATLAVLSSCETSRGDLHAGVELAGFVGAFMRAGCPSVIACMWKMPEEVSVEFAHSFYQSLIDGKSSKAAALQAALLALKKQERFDHPYFWAPLCLYGAA